MRVSAKIDYSCKALLELALHWPKKEPLSIGIIAKNQNIPLPFLNQILITLKQLGYVESIRGKNGGYFLSREPRKICLDQLVTDLGSVGYCSAEHSSSKNKGSVMDFIWDEIDQTVLKMMGEINFEMISQRHRFKRDAVMFHI
ncbi:MAG: Rrf2 family transcriptional regulator [Candidatus Omnitrophica bacterium]|nr:Rrf2 family transcriptional regulator [Candidatus Omnitrophota bacterium]